MRIALAALSFLVLAGCVQNGGGSDLFASPSRPTVVKQSYDPPIRIIEARYGTDRRSCNATRAMRRACEGDDSCSVKAGNELCGDPAPGQVKTLYVTYRCEGRPRDITRTEGKYLRLDCD